MGIVEPKTGRLHFMPRDNLTADLQAAVVELAEELKALIVSDDLCELSVIPEEIRAWYDTLTPLRKQALMAYARMWVKHRGGDMEDTLIKLAAVWQAEEAKEAGQAGPPANLAG
jgi:hypothetical protein